jgi:epoxyqueuosine reductase
MNLKEIIREKGLELGFDGMGFTGVEPLESYIKEIESRPPEMYGWAINDYFSLLRGAAPGEKYPWARSMLVLVNSYFRRSFPPELEGIYGRAYMVDERKTPGEMMARIAALVGFLQEQGISCVFDGEIPARMAAARAGLVTYGKNCFVFSREAVKNSSWIEIVPMVLDRELEPDPPSVELDCPPKCKDRCMEACPTGAIYGPMQMNPRRCIAYNTYYGEELTPMELRKPMGAWVYGCDVCQQACPRNRAWMKQDKPANLELNSKVNDYAIRTLLEMDQSHYESVVWKQFFYMSRQRIDRWQMNAARALGNLGDPDYIPILEKTLTESPHPNVRAMSAWALGSIGGPKAREILERRRPQESGPVVDEIIRALEEA